MSFADDKTDPLPMLLARAVEGTLSDNDLRHLEQLLSADPVARQRYVDHLLLDGLLTDELGVESVAGVVDMLGNTPLPLPTIRSGRRRVWWRWSAVAAALLLAVGAAVLGRLLQSSPQPVPVIVQLPTSAPRLTQVVECNGQFDLMSPEGKPEPAAVGQNVPAGQAVRTGGDNSFAVLSRAGMRLEMASDTTVRLFDEEAAGRGRKLHLSQGVVRIEATLSAESRPMIVSTPHADIVVADATFTCSTTMDATFVEVEGGKVQMVRQADGAPVELTDGFTAVAGVDVDERFVTRPASAAPTRPPTLLKGPALQRLAFDGDGVTLAGLTSNQAVSWNVKTGQRTQVLEPGAFDWRGAVLSLDGRFLAGYGKKHAVKVLDLAGPRELVSFELGGRGIHSVALSGDGSRLALVEHVEKSRTLVRVWDVASGVERPAVRVSNRPARTLSLSDDGGFLALGDDDGEVILIDALVGRELARFRLAGAVRALCFSPDGGRLAGAGAGSSLVLWDVKTRAEHWHTQAPGRPFLSLVFSPGGRFLAAGTADGTIKLLHADEGTEHLSLKGTQAGMAALAFARDGMVLAAASKKTVFVWQLPEDVVDPRRPRLP